MGLRPFNREQDNLSKQQLEFCLLPVCQSMQKTGKRRSQKPSFLQRLDGGYADFAVIRLVLFKVRL